MRHYTSENYVNSSEWAIINKGYGLLLPYRIQFTYRYSEEEKEQNRATCDAMTEEEWSEHCQEMAKVHDEALRKFAASLLTSGLKIYQLDGTRYEEEWDLSYCSNRGWNNDDLMSCFSLCFNSHMQPEKIQQVREKIEEIAKDYPDENLEAITYMVCRNDEDKAEMEITPVLKQLIADRKRVSFMTYENGTLTYAFDGGIMFLPHRNRTHGYRVSPLDYVSGKLRIA